MGVEIDKDEHGAFSIMLFVFNKEQAFAKSNVYFARDTSVACNYIGQCNEPAIELPIRDRHVQIQWPTTMTL